MDFRIIARPRAGTSVEAAIACLAALAERHPALRTCVETGADGQLTWVALRLSHVVTDEWGVKLIQDDLIARLAQPSPAPPPLSTDAGPTTSVDMADYEASPVGQRANDRALAYLADQLRGAPQTMFSHRPLAGEQPRYWTVEPRSRALLQAYHYGRHSPGALERRVTEIELERGICLDKLFRTAAVNFHLSALGVRAQVLFSTVNPANGGFGSARDLGLLYTELLHCAADGGNMLGTECCRAIIRRQSVIGFPASSVPRAYGLGFMVGLSDAGIGTSWSDNSFGHSGAAAPYCVVYAVADLDKRIAFAIRLLSAGAKNQWRFQQLGNALSADLDLGRDGHRMPSR